MFVLNFVIDGFNIYTQKNLILAFFLIQSKPPLIRVNRSKYLYQLNTGNGTAYILFRYRRTTDGDVTECEWCKQNSAPTLQGRLAYV